MSRVFTEDVIFRVKQAADIVEVISQYLPLKKAGKYFKAPCPFHGESNPSFSVNPERQMFHCFGCNEGGDVIAFVMKYQNLSFAEAVRDLAERYHLPLPDAEVSGSNEDDRKTGLRKKLFRVNELAVEFYREVLLSSKGLKAREYLQERKLAAEVVERFSLGYAPEGWDGIVSFMRRRKVPQDLVEAAGLIIPRNGTGYYDRFRDRLMFPIEDTSGRIIGFGGRTLCGDNAKYLNSPETEVYRKGRSLYGLRNAQKTARSEGRLLLVEGYMDALALVSHGIENVAATLGTALTQDQLRLAKRVSTSIVAAFDSDEAGRKAVLRNAPLFFNESVNVTVLVLPGGEDPDEYINREGRERFQSRIAEAPSLADFCIDASFSRGVENVAAQSAAVEELKPLFSAMRNDLEKNRCIRTVAERLRLDETVVGRILASEPRMERTERVLNRHRPAGAGKLERDVMRFYLQNPRAGDALLRAGIYEQFQDAQLGAILRDALTTCRKEGGIDFDLLMARHSDPETHRMLAEMIFQEEENHGRDIESILEDILNTFHKRAFKSKAEELNTLIEAAEKMKDSETVQALLLQKERLIREKAVIHGKRG